MKRGTPPRIFAVLIFVVQITFIIKILYDNSELTGMQLLLKFPLIWVLYVALIVLAYSLFRLGEEMDK